MTASVFLKAAPEACLGNDVDLWVTKGHDFHLYFHTSFDSLSADAIKVGANSIETETYADSVRAYLGSSLTHASVGGT